MLTQPIYAGDVADPDWGISARKGHHDAIISRATFKTNQRRYSEGARMPKCDHINLDFALRCAVACASFKTPVESYWAQGKNKKVPLLSVPD